MCADLRILIVDEEEATRKVLSEALAGTRHQVLQTASAKEALEELSRRSFDLLVFDLWSSNMPGLELFRQAREMHEFIEGIVVTGAISIYNVLDCYREGVADYLFKPVEDPQLFREAVEEVARKREKWLGIMRSLEFQRLRRGAG